MANKELKVGNVPNLRFPGFEGEWEENVLGGICKMQAGKFVSSSEIHNELKDGLFPCYGGNGLRGYTRSNNQNGLYSLIGRQGALCGNITLVDGKFHATEHAVVVTPNDRTDSRLLYYLLIYLNLNQYATGAAQPGLSVQNLERVKVKIPRSIAEQQKIASILSQIDQRIQTQNKIIEQLETSIKGLSEKLFSRKVRFKAFRDEWKERKLGELASFYSGGTPLTSKREYFDGNIPFIRSGEINSNKTEQFITELGLKNSSAKMVEVGDILYALYGATSGEIAISKIRGAINQAVLCLKSEENHYFIYSYLSQKKQDIIRRYLQGGQGNLSADIVKQIKLYIPTLNEQIAISQFLSSIDRKIQIEKSLFNRYQFQKQYLLKNLFI